MPASIDPSTAASVPEVALCSAQLTGSVTPVTPFNVQKQTALMSAMARTFPRLAFGFGPVQSQIVSVYDDNATAAATTATVTILTSADGDPQGFAEARCECRLLLKVHQTLSMHGSCPSASERA